MKKVIVLFLVILFAGVVNAHALNFENLNLYRYDIRSDGGGNLYFNKFTVKQKVPIDFLKRDLTLGAFVEGQYTFDSEEWTVSKVGVVGAINIIDKLSLSKDFYYVDAAEEYFWRTKLTYSIPFKMFKLEPSVKMFEEFRYNLTEGEGSRNDVGLGVQVPVVKHVNYYLGWRHAERIHSYDTDYIETMVIFSF